MAVFAARRSLLAAVTLGIGLARASSARADDCNHNGLEDAIELRLQRVDLAVTQVSAVGMTPRSIAARDFNQDGGIDLATADRHSNSISVLLQGEHGAFAEAVRFRAENPASMTSGDFNGDGVTDVAYVSTLSQYLTLLNGVPGGGFETPLTVDLLAPGSIYLDSGDLNGDGVLDLVSINRFTRQIAMILQAQGRRTQPVFLALPGELVPISLGIGNLDGDRDLDLAVAAGQVILYSNQGTGQFKLGPALAAQDAVSVAIIPSTRAGSPGSHLAWAESPSGGRVGGAVKVALALPGGGYEITTLIDGGTLGDSYDFIAAGDLNDDRRPDLLTLSSQGEILTTLSVSDGRFGPALVGARVNDGSLPRSATIVDLDQDQKPEVVTVNHTEEHALNRVVVHQLSLSPVSQDENRNSVPDECDLDCNGNGQLDVLELQASGRRLEETQTYALEVPGLTALEKLMAADVTGDGRADLIWGSSDDGGLAILENTGAVFVDRSSISRHYDPAGAIDAQDFDGDGWLDVAIRDQKHEIRVYFGEGHGAFSTPVVLRLASLSRGSFTSGDFNRDGRVDLASLVDCCGCGQCSPAFFFSTGDRGFDYFHTDRQLTGKFFASMQAFDLAADGYPDLVALAPADFAISEFAVASIQASPAGGFQLGVVTDVPTVKGLIPNSATAADLDGRGGLELIIAGNGSTKGLQVFSRRADGGFEISHAYSSDPELTQVLTVDLNQDGLADVLALAPQRRGASHWLNAGNHGRLEPERRLSLSGKPRSAAVADFNGDGFPDLATANVFGPDRQPNTISIAINSRSELSNDCDQDGVLDICELASGAETDCNFDGILDSCLVGADLDQDGITDACTGAEFLFSIDGPELVQAPAGASVERGYECVITPLRDLRPEGGAHAWAFGVAGEGLEILSATVAGTLADFPPAGLQNGGYAHAALASSATARGFVSVVVLSVVTPVTLPTDRASVVCKFVVSGIGPNPEGRVTATLSYVDGLRRWNQPVSRSIRRRGELGTSLAVRKRIVLTSLPAQFRRGDVNDDGKLDLTDAVRMLLALFAGATVTCLDAADADDDGAAAITDAVFLLRYLFLQGAAPPSPGMACGIDSTSDALTCAGSGECGS